MSEQQSETPREKNLRRVGSCKAVGCTECKAYVSGGKMDGFNLCVCTHTQNSHELGAINNAR